MCTNLVIILSNLTETTHDLMWVSLFAGGFAPMLLSYVTVVHRIATVRARLHCDRCVHVTLRNDY